jgi:hypothetical protein
MIMRAQRAGSLLKLFPIRQSGLGKANIFLVFDGRLEGTVLERH